MLFYAYLFGSASLLYLFLDSFKINLSRMVIWFHVLGTIIMMLLFFFIGYLSNELPAQEKGIDYLLDTPNYSIYYLIITLILICLQILFIINIFVSVIKKMKTPHTFK